MRVLVTGAKGFVGKNLCLALGRMEGVEVLRYDLGNTRAELEEWAGACDFVFHLAGVNRPKDPTPASPRSCCPCSRAVPCPCC